MRRQMLCALLVMILPPPRSTLFPYATLFRSVAPDSPPPLRPSPARPPTHPGWPARTPRAGAAPAPPQARPACARLQGETGAPRSEEHTTELQSRQYLVCRLLLEKKRTVARLP